MEKRENEAYQTDLTGKKIAVVGAGGVGGFLAGMLGRVCPHLTLAARGARKEAIRGNGLVLHSEYKGEITVHPETVTEISGMTEQDYIFVCVKNYSLEDVCREMDHAVTEDTVIIPVMNGVDPGDRIRSLISRGTVVDSLIYIVSFANADYSVTQQGDFADLRIGITDAGASEKAKIGEVSAILRAADIDHQVSDEIEVEIWRKYILNCAYNVATAYYDNTIGELRRDPRKAAEYEALVNEAWQVALAKGVAVTQEHVDAIIHRFYKELAGNATSSLQRDIRAGRTAETETFSGYIVHEGKKLGLDLPVSSKMYDGLKKQERTGRRMSKNKDKTNVMRILDQKKITYISHNYESTGAISGVEVAQALNQDPDMVFKTLVTGGKSKANYVFVVPVKKELDLKKAARAVGEKSIEMIKSKELLPLTGYIHGGCSPIGMKKQFVTTIDQSAADCERIIFSGGKIGYQVEMSLSDLEKVIPFQLADIAE